MSTAPTVLKTEASLYKNNQLRKTGNKVSVRYGTLTQ